MNNNVVIFHNYVVYIVNIIDNFKHNNDIFIFNGNKLIIIMILCFSIIGYCFC